GGEGGKLLAPDFGWFVVGIDLEGGGDEVAGLLVGADGGVGLRGGEPRPGLVRDRLALVDDLHGLLVAALGHEGLDDFKAQFPVAWVGHQRLGEFREAHWRQRGGCERGDIPLVPWLWRANFVTSYAPDARLFEKKRGHGPRNPQPKGGIEPPTH